jgi:AcrR family transcriptional regulator
MGVPVKTKRRYRAPKREVQADETRRRILTAARQLFSTQGYAATTLARIASTAKVATPTVYARFGSKLSLLNAIVATATSDSTTVRGLLEGLFSEPDPFKQMRLLARAGRAIYEQSWDVVEVLRSAGTADQEAAATWRESDRRARAAQWPLVSSLSQRGLLRPGLSAREAADLIWILTGPDLYRLLVVESAWTGEKYEQWVGDALATHLLAA